MSGRQRITDTERHRDSRRTDLLRLAAAAYVDAAVLVTTAELDVPGPQVLYVNERFTAMTGYAPDDILGKTPRILQGPRTDRRTLDRLRADLSSGNAFRGRAVNYRRDGTEFELEWIADSVRDESGRITHYIAVQRDISGQTAAKKKLTGVADDLHDTSERLLAATAALEAAERRLAQQERLDAMEELIAGFTHDINNAVAPVVGFLELMECEPELSSRLRSRAGDVRVSTEFAVTLIDRLQKIIQTDADTQPRGFVDLCDLVRNAPRMAAVRRQYAEADGEVRVDLKLDVGTAVFGDAVEMLQLLSNLVNNAVEAMPFGGTITVAVEKRVDRAFLQITDTGCGMSSVILRRCFEPYYTTKSKGHGFGLSVCRGIVRRIGGDIAVQSQLGKGTSFVIQLPLARISAGE